jgi:Holliday junction resolvasome RuvABC ATP-dependent DNA helicase subunit
MEWQIESKKQKQKNQQISYLNTIIKSYIDNPLPKNSIYIHLSVSQKNTLIQQITPFLYFLNIFQK